MKLDYFTLLCPEPISLSIGTLRQPTLRDIGKLTYPKFGMYQVYLKLTPKDYYTLLCGDKGNEYWNMLSDEQKKDISIYDIILLEESIANTYLEILNFFFMERVIFKDNLFFILDTDDYETPPYEIETDSIVVGKISPKTFTDVIDIIQQILCIKSDDPLDEPMPKFKNAKAKRLYEKMLKAREKQKKEKALKDYINLTLPNIISSTAMKSAGLNIVNIWDATLFQLYDQFGKAQNDDVHYLNTVRVAVWGDEDNKFDPSLWYKNLFNKQNDKIDI